MPKGSGKSLAFATVPGKSVRFLALVIPLAGTDGQRLDPVAVQVPIWNTGNFTTVSISKA